MTEQLQLDLEAVRSLADQVNRDTHQAHTGASRLLLALATRTGLSEAALVAAAALAIELDAEAVDRNGAAAA